jgi:hypothetical protein
MGSGQRLYLRQRTLAGGLSRAIYIDDDPLSFRPVEHATGEGKRLAG